MKKKLIIVIVLIILIAGGIFLYKKYSISGMRESLISVNQIPVTPGQNTSTTTSPQKTDSSAPAKKTNSSALSHAIVYKTIRNYTGFAWVGLSTDKTHVVSYPAPSDIASQAPTTLHNGYTSGNIGFNTAFINIKLGTYSQLKKMYSPTQLFSLVINRNPFTEIYDCGSVSSATTDYINKLIDSKKLSSECTKIL